MLCFSNGNGLTTLCCCFFPIPCSCVILTHTYHLYPYLTMFRQILVAGIGSERQIWGCHQPGLKWLSFNGLCEIGGWTQFSSWTCPHYKMFQVCFWTCAVLLIPTAEEGDEASLSSSHQAFRFVYSGVVVWGRVEHFFTSREQCFTYFLPLLNQSQGPIELDYNPGLKTKRTLLSLMSCSQLFLVIFSWQR